MPANRVAFAALWLCLPVCAQLPDRSSMLDTAAAIEIPGSVLPPGKYVVRLRTEPQRPNVSQVLNRVEVLDESGTRVVAKLYSLPDYGQVPSDRPLFTYYDRGSGHPKALQTWYHPSVNYGEQFVYPSEQAAQVAADARRPVLSVPFDLEPVSVPSAAPAAPARVRTAPRQLPKAGGYLPIAAWLGLVALGALFVFRAYRRDPAQALNARNQALARKVAAAAYQNYRLSRRDREL